MKKLFWMLTVVLLAVSACKKEAPDNDPVGIAMIVKNGQIDYFRQIESAFRSACQEKGLEAFYYSTSSETAYQEQVAAVAELSKLGNSALKGIIFSPSFGPSGENAEAEVAALAAERGIPVIVLDSHVSAGGPLASCPYIGTDNTAAGKAMAEYVSADKVAVFAMKGSPAIERAEAFQALKPNATVYRVGDECSSEALAVLADYEDFVFFNGSDLVSVLPMLKVAGKRVYTFDAYGEFLEELISSSPCLRGVMAQNTFAMASKAVEAVLANASQGQMVPTFYITGFNLEDPAVKPFLDFYGKQLPVIEGLSEKIIGKWIIADKDGQPAQTNEKNVFNFVSTTKVYKSASLNGHPEVGSPWHDLVEGDVAISGNKMTITIHPDEHTTEFHEFIVTAINATEFTANHKATVTVNGNVMFVDADVLRFTKVAADYSAAIVGLWQGRCTSEGSVFDDGMEHRWEYKEDGTYVYYRKDYNTWKRVNNSLNEYFVDGNLLCTRWVDDGVEYREWWEIGINGDTMNWTALRQDADGTPFTATFQMGKTTADNVRLTQSEIVMSYANGTLLTTVTEDYVWEDGLLRSSHGRSVMHKSGNVIEGDETFVYDDDGNCIEEHFVSGENSSSNKDAYFTYDDQGRMTGGVEKMNGEVIYRATITGYTPDGYIQALTVESFVSGTVYEYQLTWENGDMTGYARHYIFPEQDDVVASIKYDDYPNAKTGMPLASEIFDPQMIASKASVHNRYILDAEYSYGNGRLVKSTHNTAVTYSATYYTYSDSTTGKE